MDVAMEMVTAATPMAAETAGGTIVDPMERRENGKQGWRSEASGTALAPSDSMRRMERMVQLQALEQLQLHRTIGDLTSVLQAQAARKQGQ
jgi:hypothetical protein